MKKIELTVLSITPRVKATKKAVTEYERVELSTEVGGEISGYAVINSFTKGAFKIGDKLTFETSKKSKGAGQD